ncbi:MAG: hypothetical protein B7Z81_06700 [Acidocella sp. 20-61-6]|nr:MAG: hypothetical protein B7Z81_06700 [Acidocella sp. 20-61-6]
MAPPPGLARAPLGDGVTLPYYVSAPAGAPVQDILIAVQGYTRDANRTYDAAAAAARNAGRAASTLIVAPIFEVPAPESKKCEFRGVPGPAPDDALWHCDTWSKGAPAEDAGPTSFQAMDRLIADLHAAYPAAQRITLAGFSAGGQFVQHYVGFAAAAPAGTSLRYVVADPSEFVYFDAFRPVRHKAASCLAYDDWRYGTASLPDWLGRDAARARAVYAAADLHYLEGAADTGHRRGAAYKLLAHGCGAELEGRYRLQRGENYAAYDQAMLAHGAHTLTLVPGCAHSVTCVFEAPAARAALFGN